MTEEAECTLDICQGNALPDKRHEAAEGPVVKEQDKAESSASNKQEERGSVLSEKQRGVKFYIGEQLDDEFHSLLDDKQVSMEVGSTIEEEKGKMKSPLVEEMGYFVGEEQMEVGSPLEKVGFPLCQEQEKMESSGFEERGKPESLVDEVQGVASAEVENQGRGVLFWVISRG